jgi:4-hydroxy-tetrahydrodipicolinate reductase
MKIALVGYGKMGREIEALAQKQNIPVAAVITSTEQLHDTYFDTQTVAIEFTQPDAAVHNIRALLRKNVPVVCGTTGWLDHLPSLQSDLKTHKGTLLYATNFSIGVHLFWQSLARVGEVFAKADAFHVRGEETHHLEKKDKPSGTALSCQTILQKSMDAAQPIDFQSYREGDVKGQHRIFFESPYDVIEFSHTAKNRKGFAQGALACAQWLKDKKGLFTIEDYIRDTL